MSINEFYPGHPIAPDKSGINTKNFPNLKDLWENLDEREKNKKLK